VETHIWGIWVLDSTFYPSQSSGGGMAWHGIERPGQHDTTLLHCCVDAIDRGREEERECGKLTGGECIRISRRSLCAAGPRRRRCLRFPIHPVAVGAVLITNNEGKSEKPPSKTGAWRAENLHTPFVTVRMTLHTRQRHACVPYATKGGKIFSDSKLPGGCVGGYANIGSPEAVAHDRPQVKSSRVYYAYNTIR
jgi:hypothetical protein